MNKKSMLLAVLLVFVCAAVVGLGLVRNQEKPLQTVTVYSRNNKSLSLFRDWKEAAQGQSVKINQNAFLFPAALSGVDGIMIASPRRSIARKEAVTLSDYVRRGGRLILSAHDNRTYANFRLLLDAFDIDERVQAHATFQNQQVTEIAAERARGVFASAKQYGFYSLIKFVNCSVSALDCFVREKAFEDGQILLTLGLPLPGNAMIRHLNNMDFTLALGRWAPDLLIDEYHHFFTQKTWKDLLARADVTVPLVGMITGLILFFLFGHSRFHERELKVEVSRPYHELNENIVRKFLRDPRMAGEALDKQRQFLLRLFPDQAESVDTLYLRVRAQVDRNPRTLSRGLGELVRFHREQLRSRGRRGET